MIWALRRFGLSYRVRDTRARELAAELPLLSVSQTRGVVPRRALTGDDHGRATDLANYKVCFPGDLVINRMSAYNGALGIARQQGLVSPDYLVLEPRGIPDFRFHAYWLRSAEGQGRIRSLLRGIGSAEVNQVRTPRVNESDLRTLELSTPSTDDQVGIADYLDRETAQIDTLIAKQQQLIARLRERRHAQMVRGASQGVDGGPLKASSLGWTNHISAAWEELNLRRVATMKTGHTPSRAKAEYWEDTTLPWFTLADVWQLRDGTRMYLGETANRISELGLANSAAELLPAGTVVLSRTASVGFSGIMPVPMATSQDFWNWVCSERLVPEFLVYLFRAMRENFASLMMGSTHQTIYQPVAAAIRIPLPPLDEQRRIVAYLDEQTAKIDTLIAKAERFIELAKERRAALITAAVTGQLDVTAA